jgi:hypothetical protein
MLLEPFFLNFECRSQDREVTIDTAYLDAGNDFRKIHRFSTSKHVTLTWNRRVSYTVDVLRLERLENNFKGITRLIKN